MEEQNTMENKQETAECSTCKKQCDLSLAMHYYNEDGMTKMMWACSRECHKKFSDELKKRVALARA